MKNPKHFTDQEIARNIQLEPIKVIAERAGLDPGEIEMYGKYKAKIPLDMIDRTK